MIPTTATALGLLAAFVLPGFIVLLFQERTFKQSEELSPLASLLRSLYYSFWCYLLLAPVALHYDIDVAKVTKLVDQHKDDPAELVWRAGLVVLVPAYIVSRATYLAERMKPLIEKSPKVTKVANWIGISTRHQQPTAWDFWFAKGILTQVRIVYPDGRVLWGCYGSDSFASYAKDGLDLYLEYAYGPNQPSAENSYNTPPRLEQPAKPR